MVLELIETKVGAFSISYCFKNCEGNFKWLFTRVYGLILRRDNEAFWVELANIKGLWNDL